MSTSTLRVLVADDQPLERWAVAKALASRNHEVVTAATRDEACGRLFQRHFDVVIMARNIEGLDMTDVLRQLAQGEPKKCLIALCDGDDGEQSGEEGPRWVSLARPFDLESLLEAASQTTGVARSARQ